MSSSKSRWSRMNSVVRRASSALAAPGSRASSVASRSDDSILESFPAVPPSPGPESPPAHVSPTPSSIPELSGRGEPSVAWPPTRWSRSVIRRATSRASSVHSRASSVASRSDDSVLESFPFVPPSPLGPVSPPSVIPTVLAAVSESLAPEPHNLPSPPLLGYPSDVSGTVMRTPIIDNITQTIDLTDKIRIPDPNIVVAHGGFSDVYQGEWEEHMETDALPNVKIVAVKLLRVFTQRGGDPERSRKRLNREVNVWKRLGHPNIAKFYGISFQLGGRPAMVMQWYENGTAPDYTKNHSPALKLIFVEGVCAGLRYLHELQPPVVHGDLKGNNILVNDHGRPVLSDFGLSKVLDDHKGPSGNTTITVAGSVRWQAPELHSEGEEGEWSSPLPSPTLSADVWSLGCTIYELLTGKLPYHHWLHDWKVIRDVMNGTSPLRPDDVLIHQSKELSSLLQDYWTLDPVQRPTMGIVCSMFFVVALSWDPSKLGSFDSLKHNLN